MLIKPYAARHLLIQALKDLGLSDVHLSEAAVFRLAQAIEAYGRDLSERTLRAFLGENDHRQRLSIPRLRRLRDEDVEEALDGHEG